MEVILIMLIVALLNSSIAYINNLLTDIVPMTLYAEQYMTVVSGVNLAETLFDIIWIWYFFDYLKVSQKALKLM